MEYIEVQIEMLPEDVQRLLMSRANQWKCSPNEAAARLLLQRAKRERIGSSEPEPVNRVQPVEEPCSVEGN